MANEWPLQDNRLISDAIVISPIGNKALKWILGRLQRILFRHYTGVTKPLEIIVNINV